MNIFSLAAFLTVILSLLVTVYIFRLSSRAPITLTYAVLLFGVAVWSLGYTFMYPETDPGRLWFWYRFAAFGWIFIQSLALHFSLILTGSAWGKNRFLLIPLYAVPAVFIFRVFSGPLLISGFRQGPLGTVEIIAPPGAWTLAITAFFILSFLLRFMLMYGFQRGTTRLHLRNQARIFLATDTWVFAAAVVFNVFIPSLPGNTLPSLGCIAAGAVPVLVWISIKEHKLFVYNMLLDSRSSAFFVKGSVSRRLFGLHEIFDQIGASIVFIDTGRRIVQANAHTEKLFGKYLKPGARCYEYFYSLGNSCPTCPLFPSSAGEHHHLSSSRDGELWTKQYEFLIVEEKGEIDGVIKISFDATERMRALKRREDMERVMQHDIRNGLAGILGAAQVLETHSMDDECRRYLSLIRRNAVNLKNTINNSLDLFLMEEGRYRLETRRFDLLSVLRQVGENLGRIAETRRVGFRVLVDGREPENGGEFPVTGSPPLLENLLTNLVKNAVEASPAGETVTVALSGGVGIAVDVHNRGVVPEEIRENFFGKYVTWNKENGIGLGTYIARVIARAHGGDVSFTTDKAAGTHVTVTLPRLP